MRGRRIALGCGLVLLLAACGRHQTGDSGAKRAAEPPPPVEVKDSVDKAVATTGDVITYTVAVEHDPGIEVEVPEPGAEIAGFRIIEVGKKPPRRVRGRVVEERWYQLRADLVGSYVLPPVTVTYRSPEEGGGSQGAKDGSEQSAQTSEIFVEVESVLPQDGQATDIRGVKPLQPVATRRTGWWIGGGVALAMLLLGGAGWWWWRRRVRPAAPPIPAHQRAFQELEALRRLDLSLSLIHI